MFTSRKIVICCLILFCTVPYSQAAPKKTVNLAAMDWPPFYGENLPENGFIAAITREAFQRSGYKVEIKFMPWKRALGGTQNGLFDGVLGLYFAENRTPTLSYSESIYESEQVFVKKRSDNININPYIEKSNLLIAAQLGTLQAEEAKNEGLRVYPTNSNTISLNLLAKKRVDLALMAREHLLYIERTENNPDVSHQAVEILAPPFRHYKIYNAFSRQRGRSKEFTDAFNYGFNIIKQDGTYDNILLRFGVTNIRDSQNEHNSLHLK